METQDEFMTRRRLAREEAAREGQVDLLVQELFNNKPSTPPTQAEYDAYCFSPGWATRRQAG